MPRETRVTQNNEIEKRSNAGGAGSEDDQRAALLGNLIAALTLCKELGEHKAADHVLDALREAHSSGAASEQDAALPN